MRLEIFWRAALSTLNNTALILSVIKAKRLYSNIAQVTLKQCQRHNAS